MMNIDVGRYKRLVDFIWDPEHTNDADARAPMWCLGHEYQLPEKTTTPSTTAEPANPNTPPQDDTFEKIEAPSATQGVTPSDSTRSSLSSAFMDFMDGGSDAGVDESRYPPAFLDDFEARIWLTYRSNFPPILKSDDPRAASAMSLGVRLRSQLDSRGFTSDTGWGCMIRSGQSLLANALVILKLGRDWRRGSSSLEERRLISLFADDPRAPYSLHRFVEHGAAACEKFPGQWFGPSATARCIQALTNSQEDSSLKVYITGDGADVYEDTFMRIAKADNKTFHPTLILVGTRLGLDKITPVYWEALKSSLQMPQSIGIAGGRPSSSHYFIGVQGPYFYYLDPHETRTAIPLHDNPADYPQATIDSCHTRRLRRIHVKGMDPSMLIAFLIRDEDDWRQWRQAVQEVQGKAVIHVADRDPALYSPGDEAYVAMDEVESFDDDDDDDNATVSNT